jgi:hypothetical protein
MVMVIIPNEIEKPPLFKVEALFLIKTLSIAYVRLMVNGSDKGSRRFPCQM